MMIHSSRWRGVANWTAEILRLIHNVVIAAQGKPEFGQHVKVNHIDKSRERRFTETAEADVCPASSTLVWLN